MAPLAPSRAALLRRAAVVCAAALVPVAATASTATAAPAPSPHKLPAGLYGSGDPQYDGVWRQSLALLAQHTVRVEPAAAAVDWLTGQQCADGSFTAYRADTTKACGASTMRDTNQTGAAVQALAALGGHGATVEKAVHWLRSVQNDDGGWPSMPGSASDANSTAVVIGALTAAGQDPAKVESPKGHTPYEGLLTFRLGCAVKPAERGAFTFQLKGAAANADASAAAATGALGKGFVVPAAGADADTPVAAPECGDGKKEPSGADADALRRAASGASAYLVKEMDAHGQHLMSAMPGAKPQPDVGNTADSVVALAAGGHGAAARKPLAWLEKNGPAWAKPAGPAAYAQLVLAAHATGTDPRNFGGTDLVAALNATGPKPSATAEKPVPQEKGTGSISAWWLVPVGLAAGAGIGFLMSARRKRGQ
ncbi:prenyltransferase/squalene oxidase repeat-containing protein [Streptomyces catenulae]|uniref:Prenyltransferase/squalene oxidase repeat-containing protein n=1 Tax=Streptomyces catenulae TaxID=66875 RepID=A0ABV2YWX3_9ACTN|nr:prenyltransferase/squalene oxidase repeat-containing protein [Streptomyces catenulae]